jgi:putative membrane protein
MIKNYSDGAANERTFLAWVRTGIAIIGLGFVIERFDLFLRALERQVKGAPEAFHFPSLAGHYGGSALIAIGVALIVVAVLRFLLTAWLLADKEAHSAAATRGTLLILCALLLAVAGFSAYLALG